MSRPPPQPPHSKYTLRNVQTGNVLKSRADVRNGTNEAAQLTSQGLVSPPNGTGDGTDFRHDGRGDGVEVHGRRSVKDVEDLLDFFAKGLVDQAFLGTEGGGAVVLGGEVGRGLDQRDGRLDAVEFLFIVFCCCWMVEWGGVWWR